MRLLNLIMKKKLYNTVAGLMIVAVSIFVIHPFTAQAAVARVQAFSGTNTTFVSSVTTSSVTVTAGNLIICTAEADVATSMSISDSKGNAWTLFQTNTIAATFIHNTWYSIATIGGSSYTVTATDNGGGVDSLIICEEWSGAVSSLATVADKNTGATDGGVPGTAMSSGASAVTTQAAEIVIGTGVAAGAPTLTLGATYSNLTRVATAFTAIGFESKIVAATGAQTSTLTAGAASTWSMHVTTYKEAAAPVPPVDPVGHAQATFTGGITTFTGGITTFQ